MSQLKPALLILSRRIKVLNKKSLQILYFMIYYKYNKVPKGGETNMYVTQTNTLRGLSKEAYLAIAEMCRYANNLYNVGLYHIRQYYFQEKQFLTYESNYHVCKENENYALLQAGVSQQILRVVDRSFKSFFNLIKKTKHGEYRFQDIKLPRYRKKGDMFVLIMQKSALAIRNGTLKLPMSNTFKRQHPGLNVELPFPNRIDPKTVKEVRILPCSFSNDYFKIQYVYEITEEPKHLNTENALGIDIGVDNLATCVPTHETPFIIDGRGIKSINHYWNKERARLQSIADKQHLKGGKTKRILRITDKRNRQVKDAIRKAARYIVNYCIAHNIGTVVVGYNKDFKRSVNMGKVNNQTFTNIPFGDLRSAIQNLCERYGMQYIEQEESYTSKSSFLDNDVLPEYNAEQPYLGSFSGQRIYRGLYQSANGTKINADVNGAANILRKASRWDVSLLCRGFLANPQRIRLS